MLSFAEWFYCQPDIMSEAWATKPGAFVPGESGFGGLVRKGINLGRKVMFKNPIDWQTTEQNKPEIQEKKSQKLRQLFIHRIAKLVNGSLINPRVLPRIEEGIKHIADAFTKGGMINIGDIESILIGLHQSPKIDSKVLNYYFNDYDAVFRVLREEFNRNRDVWYNPNATNLEEALPPNMLKANAQILNMFDSANAQWEKSPYKRQEEKEAAAVNDDGSIEVAPSLIDHLQDLHKEKGITKGFDEIVAEYFAYITSAKKGFIKQGLKFNGVVVPPDDKQARLLWSLSKEARRGVNPPKNLTALFTNSSTQIDWGRPWTPASGIHAFQVTT